VDRSSTLIGTSALRSGRPHVAHWLLIVPIVIRHLIAMEGRSAPHPCNQRQGRGWWDGAQKCLRTDTSASPAEEADSLSRSPDRVANPLGFPP
jgi:hypothetical protein